MTQTPLEEEEAAATVAAGADLEAPASDVAPDAAAAPVEPKSYQAEPWVEPAGSQPPPTTTADDPSLRARLARAPWVAAGVAAGSLLVGAGLTLMAARQMRRHHPLARLRRRVGRM